MNLHHELFVQCIFFFCVISVPPTSCLSCEIGKYRTSSSSYSVPIASSDGMSCDSCNIASSDGVLICSDCNCISKMGVGTGTLSMYDYRGTQRCVYRLYGSSSNTTMTLSLYQLNMQYGSDFLQVWSCTDSGDRSCSFKIAEYTGNPAAFEFTTPNRFLMIVFTSYAASPLRGWNLTWNINNGVVNVAESCQNCPDGFSSRVGSINSTACFRSSCVSCAAGKYSEQVAATSNTTCVRCAAGKYSQQVGATSNATCADCAAGTYSSSSGSACGHAETCNVLQGLRPYGYTATFPNLAVSSVGAMVRMPGLGNSDILLNAKDSGERGLLKINIDTGVVTRILLAGANIWQSFIGAPVVQSYIAPGTSEFKVLLASYTTHVIVRVDVVSGLQTTFAGSTNPGSQNGALLVATFRQPIIIVGNRLLPLTVVYVLDSGNRLIRKIDMSSGIVSTLAGNVASNQNAPDGVGTAAGFAVPNTMCLSPDDRILYVSDTCTIRRVAVDTGAVTTFAGLLFSPGYVNGMAANARFSNSVMGLAVNLAGDRLFLTDSGNFAVRSLNLSSSGFNVETVAGPPEMQQGTSPPENSGRVDGVGTNARFSTSLFGMLVSADDSTLIFQDMSYPVYMRLVTVVSSGACITCPVGKYSLGSVALCSDCTIANINVEQCQCKAGTTGNGFPACYSCNPGTYKAAPGSAACTNCPQFSSTGDSRATSITQCQCSSYWIAGGRTIFAGYVGRDGGACTQCNPSCTDCPANMYKTNGSIPCLSCPSYSTSAAGSIAYSQCVCEPGFVDNPFIDGLQCQPTTACAPGSFASGIRYTQQWCGFDFDVAFNASTTIFNGRPFYTEICPCAVVQGVRTCPCFNGENNPLFVYFFHNVQEDSFFWGMHLEFGSLYPYTYNGYWENHPDGRYWPVQAPLTGWTDWCYKGDGIFTATPQTSTISVLCSPCPANTFQNESIRETNCKLCTTNSRSAKGSSSCSCMPGSSGPGGKSPCTKCVPGKSKA